MPMTIVSPRSRASVLFGAVSQRLSEDVGRVLFDEDASLEREPGRHSVVRRLKVGMLGVLRRVPVEHPAVRVARVAVGAPERAADVRIDRPEPHARGLGPVQNVPRDRAEVANVLLFANHGERTPKDVRVEQRALLSSNPSDRHVPPTREKLGDLIVPNKSRRCKSGRFHTYSDIHASIVPGPGEEVGVVRVARDSDRVDGSDSTEQQGRLRSVHGMGPSDEVDVTDGSAPADREVEDRRADPTAQNSTFEGRAPPMGEVENGLVDDVLHHEPRDGEQELLVGCRLGADSGINSRTELVEAEGWVAANGVRRHYVGRFVEQNARRETEGKLAPVVCG